MSWVRVIVTSAAIVAAAGSFASADDSVAAGPGALPGLARVATADPMPADAGFTLLTGYGYRGESLDTGDSHHRLAARLAASVRPRPWLGFALQLDGRYDRHLDTPNGTDDGWVGDPRILARAVRQLDDRLAFGGEAGLWFPADEPFSFAGASLEARALASYRPAPSWVAAANLGVRIDRSSQTVDDPDSLSLADRMALGASDAPALTLGIGGGWHRDRVAIVADWSWDVLVGNDAPDASRSPMRLAGGVRTELRPSLWLHADLELGLSATPEIGAGTPLVPVEPRVAVWVGASYRFESGGQKPAPPPLVDPDDPQDPVNAPDDPVADPDQPPALPPGQIRGLVRTLRGTPIGGARVEIAPLGTTVVTDSDGSFRVDVPPGSYDVTVRAPGYASQTRTLQVDENGVTMINLELRRGGGP